MSGGQPVTSAKKVKKSIRRRDTPAEMPRVHVPAATRRRLKRDDLLMTVKIETPAGDPARLSEAQRRRLQNIAALVKGEINKVEFLARERDRPGPNNTNPLLQEDFDMSEDNPTNAGEQPETGRRSSRKPRTEAAQTVSTNGSGSAVSLTPEQLSKLWEAITGGQISITANNEMVIEVKVSNLPQGLSTLLDWVIRS